MTIKNTLVVIDPTEPNDHLVQKAAASATGANSDLVVLSVMSPETYQSRQRAINDLHGHGYNFEYTHDTAVDASHNVATRIAIESLGNDATFRSVGVVGRVQDAVLETAEKYDCDHVVVTGHRRRFRDAFWGSKDLATRLEDTFPGHVSVYFDNAPPETSSESIPTVKPA